MRKPTLLETITFGLGLTLLAAFFQLRAGQEDQRQAGVQAFLAANPAHLAGKPGGDASFLSVPVGIPDQSLWSHQRIEEYSKSLLAGGEAPLAVLSIDRLAIEVPVYNGADEHNLNRGVARVRGTAKVEDVGNLGIAGHRDGFFRPLKDIGHGDLIELKTPHSVIRYRVVSIEVVDPDNVEVLAPTDTRTLTLVTCFPFYFVGHAPQRYIVKAVAQQILAT